MSDDEVQAVQDRADVIAFSTMAEMNHFNQNKTHDYKVRMQHYLRTQIDFFKQVNIFINRIISIRNIKTKT